MKGLMMNSFILNLNGLFLNAKTVDVEVACYLVNGLHGELHKEEEGNGKDYSCYPSLREEISSLSAFLLIGTEES